MFDMLRFEWRISALLLACVPLSGCYVDYELKSQCIADTLENGMLGSEILHSKGELSEAEKLQSVTETIVIGLFVCETKCNKRRITDGKLVCPP